MSIKAQWKSLAAFGVVALALTACGDDKNDSSEGPITESDAGDSRDGGGANGGNIGNGADNGNNGGTGGGGNTGAGTMDGGSSEDAGGGGGDPPLEPGVVGKQCSSDAECGAAGECRDPLRGGTYVGQTLGASGPTDGYCSATCLTNADCGEGGICFGTGRRGGECRKACSEDDDCKRANYECASLNGPLVDPSSGEDVAVPQTCQPLRTPVKFTTEVGQACSDDTDCNGGTCRVGNSFPGGYCSGSCNVDADCGAEGLCLLRLYGAGGSCYEACAVDTDCKRDGMNYGCVDANDTTKVCAYELDPLPDGVVGSACTGNAMCGNGTCKTQLETVPAPGGYCSADNCEEDAQCGAGGACVPSRRSASCYKTCESDMDCRSDYTCTTRGTTAKMARVCFPMPGASDAGP
jgi:hypothetical protein